jgi:hypothetical protein
MAVCEVVFVRRKKRKKGKGGDVARFYFKPCMSFACGIR